MRLYFWLKFNECEDTQDLLFGIWANVQGRNFMSTKPTFEGKLPLNEQDADRKRYASALPMKQATTTLILRCLWTSYDYKSACKM